MKNCVGVERKYIDQKKKNAYQILLFVALPVYF